MTELLQLIADGDLHTPLPECGRLLRIAKSHGLVRQGLPTKGELSVVLTPEGKGLIRR